MTAMEVIARHQYQRSVVDGAPVVVLWDDAEEDVSQVWRDWARGIVTALREEGFRVVPVEPTEAMADAGYARMVRDRDSLNDISATRVYRAMLAALDAQQEE